MTFFDYFIVAVTIFALIVDFYFLNKWHNDAIKEKELLRKHLHDYREEHRNILRRFAELEEVVDIHRNVITTQLNQKFAILHSKVTSVEKVLSPTTVVEKDSESKPHSKASFSPLQKRIIKQAYLKEIASVTPDLDFLVRELNKQLGLNKSKRSYQGYWSQIKHERS